MSVGSGHSYDQAMGARNVAAALDAKVPSRGAKGDIRRRNARHSRDRATPRLPADQSPLRAQVVRAPAGAESLSKPLAGATVVMTRGAGAYLFDVRGRRFLDFSSGTLNLPLGCGHPAITSAVTRQLKTGLYFHSSRFLSKPYLEVARLLGRLVPALPVVHHKLASGSDANEAAIKIARKRSGRRLIATQFESHLGESCETHSASGRDLGRKTAIVGSADFVHFPPPDGVRDDVRWVEDTLRKYTGGLAAILVEPVPFRAGLRAFPTTGQYLAGLRRVANEHDALLIFDEVQTFGWTDSLLATNYYSAEPDLVTLAKGIGFGLPLAAVLMRSELRDVLDYNDAELTPGGHVVSCAAAAACLRLLLRRQFGIEAKGAFMESRLYRMARSSRCIAGFRRFGLMAAILFRGSAEEQVAHADMLYSLAMERGLILRRSGHIVVMKPPIIVGMPQIDQAVRILTGVVHEMNSR